MKNFVDSPALFAKWLFVAPFALFGLLHFGPLEFSLPYVPVWLPFRALWVYLVGVCMLLFVASAILRKMDMLASLLLALMLLLFVFLVHIPAAISGDFKGIIAIARDTAMCGAALMYGQLFASDSSPFLSTTHSS